MPYLHIEHGVVDLDTWLKAFDEFEPQRSAAGVTQVRVGHPAGDTHHVVIDLGFQTTSAAEDFHNFLREMVWPSPNASRVMIGSPTAVILTDVRP
jgi:hypothetical protein